MPLRAELPRSVPQIDPRFFSAFPCRSLDWEEDDRGRVVLLRPRFGASRAGLWLATWLKARDYRIRLDPVGSLVWKLCDGATPLSAIAARLREQFGSAVEPAEERLHRFVMQMTRSRLLRFPETAEPPPEAGS